MFTLLTITLIIVSFCNGYMVAIVDESRHEGNDDLSFGEAWDKEVSETQETKIGAFGMKVFYIIPTIAGMISKCKCSCYED